MASDDKAPNVTLPSAVLDIDPRWEMAINAELDGVSVIETATRVGVARKTIYEWRDKEAYKAAKSVLRDERRALLRTRLDDAAQVGLDTLKDVATNSKDDKARVAASNSLLDRSIGSALQRVEHSGSLEVASLTAEQLDAKREALIAKAAGRVAG